MNTITLQITSQIYPSCMFNLIDRDDGNKTFKRRMMLFAVSGTILWDNDGKVIQKPHWFQFAKDRCFMAYKTTSTPCSCWLCRGERYNRAKSKRLLKYHFSKNFLNL